MIDCYEVLGLPHDCTTEQVVHAYKALAKLTHPDVMANAGPAMQKAAEERFKAVNLAYETLKDPEKRAAYDQTAEAGPLYARRMAFLLQKFHEAVVRIASGPSHVLEDPLQLTDAILGDELSGMNGLLGLLQHKRGRASLFRGRVRRRDGSPIPGDAFERRLHKMDQDIAREIAALSEKIGDCQWARAALAQHFWVPDRPRVLPPLKASALRG